MTFEYAVCLDAVHDDRIYSDSEEALRVAQELKASDPEALVTIIIDQA